MTAELNPLSFKDPWRTVVDTRCKPTRSTREVECARILLISMALLSTLGVIFGSIGTFSSSKLARAMREAIGKKGSIAIVSTSSPLLVVTSSFRVAKRPAPLNYGIELDVFDAHTKRWQKCETVPPQYWAVRVDLNERLFRFKNPYSSFHDRISALDWLVNTLPLRACTMPMIRAIQQTYAAHHRWFENTKEMTTTCSPKEALQFIGESHQAMIQKYTINGLESLVPGGTLSANPYEYYLTLVDEQEVNIRECVNRMANHNPLDDPIHIRACVLQAAYVENQQLSHDS